jgi:preprotein translocase subunit SecG
MTSTLFIVQIVLAILITILVLLQKSSSIGLGAYSGSNESVFGAKGPAGFLTKATFTLALLFVINTLALGYFYSQENNKSAVDTIKTEIPAKKVTIPLTSPKDKKSEVPKAPATEKKESNTTK